MLECDLTRRALKRKTVVLGKMYSVKFLQVFQESNCAACKAMALLGLELRDKLVPNKQIAHKRETCFLFPGLGTKFLNISQIVVYI